MVCPGKSAIPHPRHKLGLLANLEMGKVIIPDAGLGGGSEPDKSRRKGCGVKTLDPASGNESAAAALGIVGIGFMGMIHFLAARRAGITVAAICTRDPKKRAGDWSAIKGNFGPPGGPTDLTGVNAHASIDDLLADESVTLVDLCVPSDEHAPMAIRALEAGKDVPVEKPIALDLADADAMIAAAGRSGRKLMVAHVLPFFDEFAYALDAVRSGRFGKLLAVQLDRVIARPAWSEGVVDAGRSGGPAVDLHIHDTHFVGVLCGTPRAVRSRGVRREGAVAHLSTQYLYDDPNLVVAATSGALSMPGRPFAHGFQVWLERATITFGFADHAGSGVVSPLSVFHEDGRVEAPASGSGDPIDAFARELAMAAGPGPVPPELSAGMARQALAACLAEVRSVETGGEIALT